MTTSHWQRAKSASSACYSAAPPAAMEVRPRDDVARPDVRRPARRRRRPGGRLRVRAARRGLPTRLRGGAAGGGLEVVTRFWRVSPSRTPAGTTGSTTSGCCRLRSAAAAAGVVGFWWPNRAPARRAAQWDGIVPLNGNALGEPCRRTTSGPASSTFAAIAAMSRSTWWSALHRADPAAYEEAGATWWIGSVGPESRSRRRESE